jgi:RNA polymerase sigma-70 factor, ECF subfamily
MPGLAARLRLSCMGAAPDRAEELFHEHSRRIYAYCLRRLGSPEEAEDAVQATYLNACRSLLSGFEPKVAQAWLYKVAHNVCLTKQRSYRRRSRVERPEDIQSIEGFIAAPEEHGDELLGIEDALAGLPEQQRRAILLREWQGLSYREVATEMGLSQGAVETLIFRARRSLAAALEPEEAPERRARFLGLLDGGALLGTVKSALAGSLGPSLAAGLAVTVSTAVIAATPLGNIRAPALAAPEAAAEQEAARRPAPRVASADHDRASAEREAAAKAGGGNDLGHSRGHAKPDKPAKDGKKSKAAKNKGQGRGKPAWAGNDAQPPRSNSGANGAQPPNSNAGANQPPTHANGGGSSGQSHAGGNGKSQAPPKAD